MQQPEEIREVDCRGLTHTGSVRETNQDQFLVADLAKSMLVHQTSLAIEEHQHLFGASQGKLMVVADGMGGHAGGERASTIAVNSLANHVLNTLPWFLGLDRSQESDLEEELKAALQRCQRNIQAEETKDQALRGMGTTLTMAYAIGARLYIVHAGDSRGYLFRENVLHQVTKDQTMAQALVDQGALSQKDAETSRFNHILSNCIGGGTPDLSPVVYKITLQPGDIILLSTDGLTNMVKEDDVVKILAQSVSSDDKCKALVEAALAGGGKDNVTVVVAKF
jgi:protein phosphatase